jgi:hypothetical protein
MKISRTTKYRGLIIFLIILVVIITNIQSEFQTSNDFKPLVTAYSYSKKFVETYCEYGKNLIRSNNGYVTGISFTSCSNSVGLYLKIPSSTFKSDPIFVPWNDISESIDKNLGSRQSVALRFSKVPYMQITFSKETWKELSAQRKR